MQQSGCELTPTSFNTMINTCAKGGDLCGAERWLREMDKAGVQPNVRSYSSIIDACCKTSQVQRAEELFAEMCEMGITPTIVTYTSLARPHAKQGDWRRVEALKEQMARHGVKPNAFFLCGLLTAYANASPKESARAEREFTQTVNCGIDVDSYVVSALERAVGRDVAARLTNKRGSGTRVNVQGRRS